jgi:SAM-dependent methyltransferase
MDTPSARAPGGLDPPADTAAPSWSDQPTWRSERAMSFGAIAEDYDRFRPGPPPEAARWVLGDRPGRVLDLGAGTGGLTRPLSTLTQSVYAAEPDERMRAVLVDRMPGVRAVGARGEALPFATGSLDGVVVSSAWHWMDPAVAVPEVARVLRPGGVFGLLWNGPDRRVEWVSELLERRRRFERPPRDAASPGRPRWAAPDLAPDAPFGAPEATVVRWSRQATPEDLAGLAGTYSSVITFGPGRRQTMAARTADIAARHPELFTDGTVELPFACRCWRAVRTADRVA